MGDEIELEVTGHGRPVEEVRFVEGTDLASDEFRVAGELPEEPWSKWGGPRDKSRFEGVDEGGAGHVFGDGMVAVAAGLGLEFIEALRRHEHDFRGVVGLSEIEQWEVAAGVESRVVFGAAGRDAGDEGMAGKRIGKPAQHFSVQRVFKMEDVAGVGIEDRNTFHAVVAGGVHHPLEAVDEAVPVGAAVGEREQSGGAEPRFAGVGDEGFFGGPGPDGFRPWGLGLQIGGVSDQIGAGHGRRRGARNQRRAARLISLRTVFSGLRE